MEHTPSVEIMISIVEAYILEKKGRKVKIVFNDAMSIQRHMAMLVEAYRVATT
jgi:hypothetical protein